MREETKKKKCPFFDVCAAYIIWEKLGHNWSEKFCFADFETCVHYQNRVQTNAFITKKGKKVKIHPN